jgi:SAM-dependent methyltransferase
MSLTDRRLLDQKMRDHYQAVWQRGDEWNFETSEFEQQRYAQLLQMVQGRRYGRALEIGCASGQLTRLLAGVCDRVVAIDVAPAAIERARVHTSDVSSAVDLRVANIMEFDVGGEGPWDLIVLSETVYSLGWLYPMFDVAFLASQMLGATARGGRLLLANTYGRQGKDWLMQSWLIDTYRDMFRNVGFQPELEEVLRGVKDGVDFRTLVTLFTRPS